MNQKKTQTQLLKEQYAILEAIYKCLPVGIEVFDEEGYIVTINKKGLELYGLNSKEDAANFNLFKDPNLTKRSAQALQKGNFIESVVHYDFDKWETLNCKSYHSHIHVFDLKMTTLTDDEGKKMGYLLVTEDVSDKRTKEIELESNRKELRKLNLFLQTIIQNIPVGLFIKDAATGRYIIVNEHLAKITHRKISDYIGNTMYNLLDKTITDVFEDDEKKCVALEGAVYTNTRSLLIDGETVSWTLSEKLVRTIDGKVYFVGIEEDTTKKELLMKELKQAKKDAEISDKLKSVFLANMSHEIRTPLNAIVGFSDLICDAETEEEKKTYSNIINSNSELLLRLVNDILDLSKIESGSMKLFYEKFDFSQFFDEVTDSLRSGLTNENIEYIVDNPCLSVIIDNDKHRLAQAITNYVSNAIKYTPDGFVKVGYKLVDNGIEVCVADSGIGIADDKKNKVFCRFEKLDQFAQGNGLGLSITKGLIESMGGNVSFNSKEGVGSSFSFWVPLEKTASEQD